MRLSIAAKINFFLLFIFSMVLVFSAAYQAVRERDLILTLIKEQSREQTEAYFDGLNMLMLTGKMDARDTLRAKFLRSRPRGRCPHRARGGGQQAVRAGP